MDRVWYQWYDKEVPHSIFYPPVALKDWFLKHVHRDPDKEYIIINDTVITYGQCNSMSRRFANALMDMGVKKGDRVALTAPNVPQYIIAQQACFKIGAIVVPVNPLATVREIQYAINDSGAETIVSMAMFAGKSIEVLKGGDTPLKRVIVFQVKGSPVDIEKGNGILDFEEVIGSGADTEPDVKVLHTDTAMLQYTGGTTGVSKGCKLSNYNLSNIALQDSHWLKPIYSSIESHELKTLTVLPLYHIYGFNFSVNMNLIHGGSIVLVTPPTIDNILDNINRHEPNLFQAVPTIIIELNHHPDIGKSKISSIMGLFCGSAPLPVEAMKTFEELSGAKITEGYGSSETSNVLTVNPIFTKRKTGSVGIPWPDNDIKIVDLETGTKEMPVGEPGELIAKGPTIMSEYWEKPEETEMALKDGWFYTGDIAYMDEDGYFFIVDRKKDMVISSGFNVYPRDIDELMYGHPSVLRACAIGVPDEKRGESIKLFIVTKPDMTMTEEEVIAYCKESLSAYKVPKYVEFIDELPLTSFGKPDRKALRQMEMEKRGN